MSRDPERIELAMRIAGLSLDAEGHAHSLRVWGAVKEAGGSVDAQVAALLHDVFEDALGPRVARVVDLLTRRTLETYGEYIVRILAVKESFRPGSDVAGEDATIVKVADIRDNLHGRPTPPRPGLRMRYRNALQLLGVDPDESR